MISFSNLSKDSAETSTKMQSFYWTVAIVTSFPRSNLTAGKLKFLLVNNPIWFLVTFWVKLDLYDPSHQMNYPSYSFKIHLIYWLNTPYKAYQKNIPPSQNATIVDRYYATKPMKCSMANQSRLVSARRHAIGYFIVFWINYDLSFRTTQRQT